MTARLAIAVVLTIALPSLCGEGVTAGSEGLPRETRRVRTTTRDLQSALDGGVARSSTLRELIDRLEQSDVIVYISPHLRRDEGIDGELQLAVTTPMVRYVRITVREDLPQAELIAMIGHELQHAVEIAAHPAVVDSDSLQELYRSIGYQHARQRYETEAAQRIAVRVLMEVEGYAGSPIPLR